MLSMSVGVLSLWAAALAWSGSGSISNPPAKPTASTPAKAKSKAAAPQASTGSPGTTPVTSAPQAAKAAPVIPAASVTPAAGSVKPVLADAFIAQGVLRVFLNRPASISVYNSRGQQVCHLDSRGNAEAVPLQGISTGFVYLTVRTAQGEMTKKLVYTGK
jgi:hypothetical protein